MLTAALEVTHTVSTLQEADDFRAALKLVDSWSFLIKLSEMKRAVLGSQEFLGPGGVLVSRWMGCWRRGCKCVEWGDCLSCSP